MKHNFFERLLSVIIFSALLHILNKLLGFEFTAITTLSVILSETMLKSK